MSENPPQILRFGLRIREARKERKWSQSQLADKAEVSRPTIARIERGDDVSTATLAKVTAALDIDVELKPRS